MEELPLASLVSMVVMIAIVTLALLPGRRDEREVALDLLLRKR